jgi:NTE family protein
MATQVQMRELPVESSRSRVLNVVRPDSHQFRSFNSLSAPEPTTSLDDAAWQALLAACVEITVRRGEALYQAGDAAHGMYILANGRVQLRRDTRDPASDADRSAGAIIGSEGVFGDVTRDHGAFATRDCRLLYLSRSAFEHVCLEHPRAAVRLTQSVLQQRERRAKTPQQATQGLAFAILPLGKDVPVRAFARRLQAALDASGSALHLHAGTLEECMGHQALDSLEHDLNDQRIVGWLNDREARHDFTVYEADSTITPWTERCIRQADQLILVGRAGSDPAPSEIEEFLARHGMDTMHSCHTLVLVQPEGQTEITGTLPWLANRRVASHHHVSLDRAADFERLARCLTGRSIGLVLGSGGARCFAHLGVLRALREAGIAVDVVGGVSLGALIAAHVAMGAEPHELLARGRALMAASRSPLRGTLPLVSIFRASGLSAMLDGQFGDRQIEDLPIPYFCATSNLHSTRLMLHTTGRLAHYVRASCSAPGLLPPVLDGGDLLVDGAVLNAVPVHAMRDRCRGGKVIAVDVSAEVSLQRDYQFGHGLGGWHMLWSRVNPLARSRPHAPSIISVLMRSAELSSVHHGDAEVRTADLYIQPPVADYKMFDVRSFDAIVEHGYHAAVGAIEQWQRRA